MTPGHDRAGGPGGRRRALLILTGAALLVLALLVGVIVSLTSMFTGDDPPNPDASETSAAAPAPDGASVGNGPQAEAALAGSAMLDLPVEAASPRTLSTRTAGPPIALPEPSEVVGTVVAAGFDSSEEGALAQLVELTKVGLSGGDPQTWAGAYASIAEAGAAPAEQTRVYRDLVDLRRGANMRQSGPLRAGMTMSWTPTSAMIKGSTDDGTYTVACVLGEFVADNNGRVINAGWGNCLPMRRVDDQWRVASGPTAAPAPSAWPGSDEAVAAGWREIQR
ncbi:hypothetical protein WIS52_20580 [Pseudonocardia nematodicida]|uniref:Mce-associated membrane protein n=1 Tax=Pseudonocardia nematodicida TaxID=1206997 RepID=A0ABV1KEI3_9PSEU